MKPRHILFLMLMLLTATSGLAQYRINRQKLSIEGGSFVQEYPISDQTYMQIQDFKLDPGGETDVTVQLFSELPIWMLQLYLQLPEGITVTNVRFSNDFDYWSSEGEPNPNSLTWDMIENELRVITMNNPRELPIPASPEGISVLTLHIKASADMALGDYTISTNSFKFVAATSEFGRGYIGKNTTCNLSIIISVQSISLNKSNTIIYLNGLGYEQLQASITPSNATDQSVEWSSNNEAVATVDENGMVTAHAVGTATIVAKSMGWIEHTRQPFEPSGIYLRGEVNSWNASADWEFSDEGNGIYVLYDKQLSGQFKVADSSWSSGCDYGTNGSQIEIDTPYSLVLGTHDNISCGNNFVCSRIVLTIANGQATLLLESPQDSGAQKAYCFVEVRSYVESININVEHHELTLDREDWVTLTATVLPENAYNKELVWTSLDPSVATVDSEGNVRGITQGTTSVIATAADGSGVSDTLAVIVKHFTHAVSISPKMTVLYLNETRRVTAAVDPADATDPDIEWFAVNPEIATIDANGLVTGHSVGRASIIAVNYGGWGGNAVIDTATVDVRAYVESITLNKESTELYIDDTEYLTATVLPANAFNTSIIWTTSDTTVATVDDNGLVTAVGRGTATITVTTTDGTNLSASCQVDVLPPYALEMEPLSHLRGTPADTVEVAIRMINKELISDLQFDITLPEDVEFAELYGEPDVWLNDERKARNHQLSMSLLDNGKYRVLVSSPTSRTFKDHDGPVIFMNVILPQYHDAGDYYVTFSNIKLAEADETPHTLGDYTQTIHYSYILGDADADTELDVADYTATALNILELPTKRFYEDAANVNDTDPVIDVYDLRGIVNIILGYRETEIRPAPAHGASEADEHYNEMALGGEFSISNSQFSINLENGRGVAAMQMDVTLPAGVTVSDATLTDRASRLQLDHATLADGKTRLLISACSNAVIEPGDGAVVTLTLEGMTDGTITVDNILAVEPNLTGHRMQPLCMTVSHTGVNRLSNDEGASVRVEGGSLVIDSDRAGTAQLVMLNGIVMPLQVTPGRNSYPLQPGCYILHYNGKANKVLIHNL